MEVWSQWHNIPPEAITKEGLLSLATNLGTPLSEVLEAFSGVQKFYKIKVMVPIDSPLKDRLQIQHPTIGTFSVYLVYEKLNKICLFCSKVGYEHMNCADKIRMERLKLDPRFSSRQEMTQITQLKVGPWISNLAFIPQPHISDTIPDNHQTTSPITRSQPSPQTDPDQSSHRPNLSPHIRTGSDQLNRTPRWTSPVTSPVPNTATRLD